jgi:hypothetical protein
MFDLTEIFDAIENLFETSVGAESSMANVNVDQLVESLNYAGIDIADLPPEQASEVVTAIEKQIKFGDSWTDPVDDGKGIYDSYNTRYETVSEFVAGENGRSTY